MCVRVYVCVCVCVCVCVYVRACVCVGGAYIVVECVYISLCQGMNEVIGPIYYVFA